MSIQDAWQGTLHFSSGQPIVVEPSAAQLSSDAGLLPIRAFDERIGWTRQFAEALDDPRQPAFIVVLPATNKIVQPDCFYVSSKTFHSPSFRRWYSFNPTRFFGAPDVVCEIVSPSRADADQIVKMERYAQAGVKEFWLATFGAEVVSEPRASASDEAPLARRRGSHRRRSDAGWYGPPASPRVLFRIHTLLPNAAAYRPADYAAQARSDFFDVTLAVTIDKEGPPHRCRLTMIKPTGSTITFVV